eukprot:2199560-Rhodomonas_salina.1
MPLEWIFWLTNFLNFQFRCESRYVSPPPRITCPPRNQTQVPGTNAPTVRVPPVTSRPPPPPLWSEGHVPAI